MQMALGQTILVIPAVAAVLPTKTCRLQIIVAANIRMKQRKPGPNIQGLVFIFLKATGLQEMPERFPGLKGVDRKHNSA